MCCKASGRYKKGWQETEKETLWEDGNDCDLYFSINLKL
jgi:hypothetical protein